MLKSPFRKKGFFQKYQWIIAALIIAFAMVTSDALDVYKASIKITPTATITPTSTPTPTLTPNPIPTPLVINIVIPNPTPKYDPAAVGKKIREELVKRGFTEAYKGISDEALGSMYLKKYGTDEFIPPAYAQPDTSVSIFRDPTYCSSYTIGSNIYTNCY